MRQSEKQTLLPTICLGLMILLIFGYGFLLYGLPTILANYSESGEVLPLALKIMINITHPFANAEIIILPLLGLGFVASLIWLLRS